MSAPRKNPTLALIDELLAEQGQLQTPVARFSAGHDSTSLSQLSALRSQLIPLSTPGPGEHYAFEVDLDSCTGCKACVSACHSLNGLDDEETWRDVGLLVSEDPAHPFTQTVTTACHHCADPACLNGCPVLAYEKDPVTGVVVHLDDQCIGCSYCVLKCPYDVPKYNPKRGIVRKCDMCHGRLAAGEAPACAQACPTHAIKIITVPAPNSASAFGAQLSALNAQLPPHPSYTQPTTRYVSKKPLPQNLVPADAATLKPQPTHWPLALMLTLLPLAVGTNILAALLPFASRTSVTYYVTLFPASVLSPNSSPPGTLGAQLLLISIVAGALGLFASVFHLGKPLRAWRIFLGLRRSWLSREAVLFGLWFPVVLLAAVSAFDSKSSVTYYVTLIPSADALLDQLSAFHRQHPAVLPTASAVIGTLALFCSVMIYVDTRRQFWRFTQTAPRFFGTALILALALVAPVVAAFILVAKLAFEARALQGTGISARHLRGPLRRTTTLRFTLSLAALPFLLVPPLVAVGWVLALAGELTERVLFFRAVDAPKMPGLPA